MRNFDELKRLPGTPQEIAWLDERLSTLSVKESIILSAALMKAPAQSAGDAINHLLSLSDHEVCAPTGSYKQLGRFYLRYDSRLPKELHAFIDMGQLGERYEEAHPGLFIGNCYVQYPKPDHPLPYDGANLGELEDSGWSIKLKLASARVPGGVWVRLPDYSDVGDERADEIRLALDELGVQTIDECHALDTRCVLPEISDLLEQYPSLDALIYDGQNLGFALDERGQGMPEFEKKLSAALEYEHCRRLDEALDIIRNLHCYELIPESGLREYAMTELKKYSDFNDGSPISGCFDYEAYADELLKQRGFLLTRDEQAYVGRNEQPFIRQHREQELSGMVLE